MTPTSEVMDGSPRTRSYQELLRVTGPLLWLVLRTEDVWQRYNQYPEVCGVLNQGFPFSPLQCRQVRTRIGGRVVHAVVYTACSDYVGFLALGYLVA